MQEYEVDVEIRERDGNERATRSDLVRRHGDKRSRKGGYGFGAS